MEVDGCGSAGCGGGEARLGTTGAPMYKIAIPFHRATEALECAARTARAGRRRTRAEEVGGRKKNTGSKQARV